MDAVAVDTNIDLQDLTGLMFSGRLAQPAISLVHKDVKSPIPGVLHGSGGKFTVTYSQSHSGADISFVVHKGNSLAIAIEKICATFCLTKEQLAETLGTTRKTIYNWIEGRVPRANTLDRIHELQMAANEWTKSGLPVPNENMREPVIGDLSLFELLKQADKSLILFAGNRLSLRGQRGKSLTDPFA